VSQTLLPVVDLFTILFHVSANFFCFSVFIMVICVPVLVFGGGLTALYGGCGFWVWG
jgi:hypothetical protein